MLRRISVGLAMAMVMVMALLPACALPVANSATTSTAATAMETPTASGAAATPSLAPTPSPTPAPTATPTASPTPTVAATPTLAPTATTVAHDGGPDAIGLYVKTRAGVRERVSVYDEKWVRGRDIAVFDAFASSEAVLKGDYKKVFLTNWNKHPKWQEYKIGYCLSFTLDSGEIVSLTIRSPKDAPKDPKKYFYQYIEVYLYDDIHSKGWYSHLVESKVKKDTLMTSIKVTAGRRIADVKSAELTVFVFRDDSDFDGETGAYIGPVSHTISIRNGGK